MDLKVPQVDKDPKVQREIQDHLALMAHQEVKVKKAILEIRVHRDQLEIPEQEEQPGHKGTLAYQAIMVMME